jgi:thiol-disulfide isomerase/thioredoxin
MFVIAHRPYFQRQEENLMQFIRKVKTGIRMRLSIVGLIAVTTFSLMTLKSIFASDEVKASPSASASTAAYSILPRNSRALAPDLNLADLDGKRLKLSAFRGHVVLLDFWAVDCGGCIKEIPWYVEFGHKYRSKGLSLIGLDMYGETPERIRPFMSKTHMEYPVAVGNDAIRKQFHAQELPMTLLIDKQGRIALSHVGIVDKNMFERDIQELLR